MALTSRDRHPRPPRHTRFGRRLARAVGGLLVAVAGTLAATPAGLAMASPTAATGAAGLLDGVVVRLAVEGEQHRTQTWLRTSADRYVAVLGRRLDGVPTGTRVRLDPVARGRVTILSRPTVQAARIVAMHTVTVVLAQPPGVARDSTSLASLVDAVRGPVADYWAGQTRGRIAFTVGGSANWVPVTASCTDVWGLWRQVAAKTGFVEGARRHLLVYVPANPACPTGLGTIGADADSGGYAYVRAVQPALLAHELGHNLGLGHSGGLQCDGAADAVWTSSWSTPCRVSDYRDWYDVMGVSWNRLGSLSTAQAYRLGVLDAGQVRQVALAGGPVTVTLHPVGSEQGVVSLRITDPAGGTYVVEYRPAAGQDAWLASPSLNWRGLRPGVLVRRVDPTRGPNALEQLLLDATPSPTAGFDTDFDAALPAGQTLTTGSRRVQLRVDAEFGGTATVSVAFDTERPGDELDRLGSRLTRSGGTAVDPAPIAMPWVGAGPAHA